MHRDALTRVDLFVPLWSQVRTMTNGINVEFLREKNDIGLPREDYQHLFGEDPLNPYDDYSSREDH